MGDIASINFKPTKLSIQEKHNDRSVTPSYVLKSGGLGFACNRNAKEARVLRDSMVEQAKIHYKQHFNQPFKSTNYLWSAVVNVKPTTTMQELEHLALRFKKRFKFQCYQIVIHRDEGHVDEEGVEHINHHAHLEFVTLHPITGKSMYRKEYINFKTASYMQKLTAKVLQMQRGKPKHNVYDYQGNVIIKGSGAKRIEPRAYGRLMEKARAQAQEQLETDKKELQEQYQGYLSPDKVEKLQQQTNTAKQTLINERKARQDEIKEFCKELRQTMAGKGFKREHFSQLEQWAKQAQDQAIDFTEFQRVALAIFSEQNTMLENAQKQATDTAEQYKNYLSPEQVAEQAEQYKDYLSPQQVQDKIKTQYKDHLSPDQVEAKRLEDFKNLCLVADVDSKDIPQKADGAKESLMAHIKQSKTDLSALCERAGGGNWQTPKYAKEHLEKGIDKLKEQADKTKTAETAKASLETAISTAYSALIEMQDQDNNPTAQDKLKAIETRFQLEKNKTEILDIVHKDLNTLCESLGITVDQNSTLQDMLKRLTEAISNIKHAQMDSKEPAGQNQGGVSQDSGAITIEQKAKAFFENYSKEHKNAILHGFVCKEWVFWMDDANGKELKARLEKVTDDKLIQSLKTLSFDDLETANDNFNGLLHNFGCSVQSIVCMPRSCLPKSTELTFHLYDALAPKAPEIELEQFTAQTMPKSDLEKETLDLIAEISKIDPTKATEMATEYTNITDDYARRLDEFNGFLESELLKSQQKGTQKSVGKHK
ncbi:hypothetical protein NHP21005_19480 (plasmid) [Helicobacter sp. NHP21005]|uniref:hypothetical protein n=1 Tax=Helicobacter felistomachi TaxID=3040201 RepID=UPI002572F9D2|nr:hypothetical protein [Helicobacter sp. NHP21005]BEG58260.1 hypothetical protein NHP21005_19480 [Helicobacter sp. NHP21005]